MPKPYELWLNTSPLTYETFEMGKTFRKESAAFIAAWQQIRR